MKALEKPGFSHSMIAAADHTAKRYLAAIVDADGKAAIAGAGAVIAGVIHDGAPAGQPERIVSTGIVLTQYGGGVTMGDKLSTDAAGKFVKATDPVVDGTGHMTTVGTHVVGIALTTGVADDIGCALLK